MNICGGMSLNLAVLTLPGLEDPGKTKGLLYPLEFSTYK